MRWKFDEEEWKDRFNKAFDKALAKWRLSVTDCSMEHQTTSANKEVHEVDIVREKGYAAKVFDGSLERNLEEYEMEYAEKVFDGSPETVFTSTGTHLDFSALIHSHFNDYAIEKGTDVGGYGRVGTENWGCYKDGGSGGGPGQGRLRTLDIPRFDCNDSDGWIRRVEQLLYVYRVSENELLKVIEMAFVGDVLRWYQWENNRRPFRCWSDLKGVILRQYRSSTYQNFRSSYDGHGEYGGRSDGRSEEGSEEESLGRRADMSELEYPERVGSGQTYVSVGEMLSDDYYEQEADAQPSASWQQRVGKNAAGFNSYPKPRHVAANKYQSRRSKAPNDIIYCVGDRL